MKLIKYLVGVVVILMGCLGWVFFKKEHVIKEPPLNFVLIITDDQSWEHLGCYGDPIVRTPHIDLLAENGIRFVHHFNSAPACAPSRASMLTGKHFWELEEAAIHFSFFPGHFTTFTDLLSKNNYHVAYTGKGWGPGKWEGYRTSDPCGEKIESVFYDEVPKGINQNHYAGNFEAFLKVRKDQPFFFTIGTTEPHRDLAQGMGKKSGLNPDKVIVPGFLPDHPIVREDILDYYYEIEWIDRQVGEVLNLLNHYNLADNTVIIFTSDNGMAFPRAKSNLYDHGSRLPLIISGPGIGSGIVKEDFTSLPNMAPTILEAAGISIPETMNHHSLWPILTGQNEHLSDQNKFVVMGKELHGWCQPDGEINPTRAIRTKEYLYIENLKPNLWPAGHPDPKYAWDLMPFGDVDGGPSKSLLLEKAALPEFYTLYQNAFGKRPAEELYFIDDDPYQLTNLALKPGYKAVKTELQETLHNYLKTFNDPRMSGETDKFDNAPYFWSQGLSTGGLPPDVWSRLESKKQQVIVDSLRQILVDRQFELPVQK